jgi:hypothetical protein
VSKPGTDAYHGKEHWWTGSRFDANSYLLLPNRSAFEESFS